MNSKIASELLKLAHELMAEGVSLFDEASFDEAAR